MSDMQRSIERPVSLEGVGLHTGTKAKVTFCPRGANEGLSFIRTDLPGKPVLRVHADNACLEESLYLTALGQNEQQILTVEHVLAAVQGLGIDNLAIEIDSREPPIMDGSAEPFVLALRQAGIRTLDCPRKYLRVTEPIWLVENGVELAVIPSPRLEITYKIDYDHPAVGIRSASFLIQEDIFAEKIAPARTFCFLKDIEVLRAEGKIKGGSIDCAVVIGEEGFLNEELRFHDEIIRHKILDVVGDLALLGQPLLGHVVAVRSGHAYNVRFVRKILEAVRKQKSTLDQPLDSAAIQQILPHRYPFLLIDRIIELDAEEKRIVAIKNVTSTEPYFQGHFPGEPVMPGVLLIEAMAQAGGALLLRLPEYADKFAYLSGVRSAKIRRPAVPGDQLIVETTVSRLRGRSGLAHGTVTTADGTRVAEAEMLFTMDKGLSRRLVAARESQTEGIG